MPPAGFAQAISLCDKLFFAPVRPDGGQAGGVAGNFLALINFPGYFAAWTGTTQTFDLSSTLSLPPA
jgi:hypothetical protein